MPQATAILQFYIGQSHNSRLRSTLLLGLEKKYSEYTTDNAAQVTNETLPSSPFESLLAFNVYLQLKCYGLAKLSATRPASFPNLLSGADILCR